MARISGARQAHGWLMMLTLVSIYVCSILSAFLPGTETLWIGCAGLQGAAHGLILCEDLHFRYRKLYFRVAIQISPGFRKAYALRKLEWALNRYR